jgi:hypothetical protein
VTRILSLYALFNRITFGDSLLAFAVAATMADVPVERLMADTFLSLGSA